MSVEKIEMGGWVFYLDTEKEPTLHTPYVGKWMYFFDKNGADFADRICKEAVESGAVAEAKHTNNEMLALVSTGVCCFYCNGIDKEAHKKIIAFMLKNEMIQRTKTGRLYNISFKLDAQTIQREQVVDELTGKKSVKEKLIFPRYHQRDAVRQLLADAEFNGTRLNYLIEHSAGSGKTNTIAWLAHRLVSLHDTQNHIVYDSVLVITDRVVVDRQLQDAIKGIDHKSGLVCTIDDKKTSADLADALMGNSKIIVTTIQKFLYVDFWKLAQNQNEKTFAIIIDEAHSSTSGKDMIAVKNTLGQNDGPEENDAQDAIENEVQRHGKPSNVSIFAFNSDNQAFKQIHVSTVKPKAEFRQIEVEILLG